MVNKLKCCLTNRLFKTRVGEEISDIEDIKGGVPQRSVLGQFLTSYMHTHTSLCFLKHNKITNNV